jgi:hypothetical protein
MKDKNIKHQYQYWCATCRRIREVGKTKRSYRFPRFVRLCVKCNGVVRKLPDPKISREG